MKLYLDTNIIWNWFEKNIKNIKKRKSLETTSVMNYLFTRNLELYVSFLTRAEIYRFLKSQHSANKRLCKDMWNIFVKQFNVKQLKVASFELNLKDLVDICLKVPLGKKTIINLVHIQIAKISSLMFLSGDKIVVKRLKWYYDDVTDYPSLRKQVP